jgi:hypothetical protein
MWLGLHLILRAAFKWQKRLLLLALLAKNWMPLL